MSERVCVVPGCSRSAPNSLGVRLRKPPQADAWWSPNTGAYVCDAHAKSGARITLTYEATETGKVETTLHIVAERPITHSMAIK